MQRARRHFLAGPGFARDQYRGSAARHQADGMLQLPHLVAPSHQHPLPIFRICLSLLCRNPQQSVFDHPVDQPEAVLIRREELTQPKMRQVYRLTHRGVRVPGQYGNSWSSALDRFQQRGGPPPGIRKFEHDCRIVRDG